MDFKTLKQKSVSSLNEMIAEMESKKTPKNKYSDDRFWDPKRDEKTGNGFAVIRFLPTPAQSKTSFIKVFERRFKGPTGQWYINSDLSTIGQDDPVYEKVKELYASKTPENIELAKKMKRNEKYIANILVLHDPANRENEGKVFLYKFGPKIYGKIEAKMISEFEGDTTFNPFDPWNGANFKLKIKKDPKAAWPNYDDSEFDSPSPLFGGDDAKIEAVWKKEYDLSEFEDPKNFKSYDELKTRMLKVLGISAGSESSAAKKETRQTVSKPVAAQDDEKPWDDDPTPPTTPDEDSGGGEEEDDEAMNFFKNVMKNK